MKNGNFYFSTGVKFKEIIIEKEKIELKIIGDDVNEGLANTLITDSKYTTQLISKNGEIIEESYGKKVNFSIPKITNSEDSIYFRTKTISSTGSVGWTQPLFI